MPNGHVAATSPHKFPDHVLELMPHLQYLRFPSIIDATITREFRACPHKAFLEHFTSLSSPVENTHLVAGGAFARGLEVARKEFYNGGTEHDLAIARGIGALVEAYGEHEPVAGTGSAANKTLDRMIGAMEYYFAQWPMTIDTIQPLITENGAAVEFSFAWPFHEHPPAGLDIAITGALANPDNGDPILYGGRFDMLGVSAGTSLCGLDDKTTTQLGNSWSAQWELRSQFTGYCWGAEPAGFRIRDFYIRGISILKEKYGHAQAYTDRSDHFIERWYVQTYRDILRMIDSYNRFVNFLQDFDRNLDESCSQYGGCHFANSCKAFDPSSLLTGYVYRPWHPLQQDPTAQVHVVDEQD